MNPTRPGRARATSHGRGSGPGYGPKPKEQKTNHMTPNKRINLFTVAGAALMLLTVGALLVTGRMPRENYGAALLLFPALVGLILGVGLHMIEAAFPDEEPDPQNRKRNAR